MLTINKALVLSKLPRADQLEAFTQLIEERSIDKVIRRTLARSNEQEPRLDPASILAAFQLRESCHPGSIGVRRSGHRAHYDFCRQRAFRQDESSNGVAAI
jgi:hypothetical protein